MTVRGQAPGLRRAVTRWLPAASICSACQGASDTTPSSPTPLITERLGAEFAAASALLSLRALVFYALIVLGALGLVWLARTCVITLWRLGFDNSRSLARVQLLTKLLVALGLPGWLMLKFTALAPMLGLLLIPPLLALLVFIFARQLQNVGGGVALALSRRIREGDRIEVGTHQGIVREVGLTRIQLRRDDGSSAYVPNRFVLGEVISVSRERNTAPVEVQLSIDGMATAEQLHTRARQLALLCPYRVAGTQVQVQVTPGTRALSVTVQTWAEAAVPPCRTHLLRTLSAAFNASQSETASGGLGK